MKTHIGVDDMLGLIHIIDRTAINVHDVVPYGKLLSSQEQRKIDGFGYLGMRKRDEHIQGKNVLWFIDRRSRTLNQVFGYTKVPHRDRVINSNSAVPVQAALRSLTIGEKYLRLVTHVLTDFFVKMWKVGKRYTNEWEVMSKFANRCRAKGI